MNVEIGRMMSLTRSPIPMIQLSYTTKHWKIIRICLFAMLSDCKLIHINFNFSSILKSQTKLHRLCSKRMSTYLRSEQKLEIFRMSRRKWCQSPPKQTNGSFKYAVKVDGRTLNDYKKDFVGRYIAWELKLENGNRLYLEKNQNIVWFGGKRIGRMQNCPDDKYLIWFSIENRAEKEK